MTIIGTLAVSLKANTQKFRKGMKKADKITDQFARKIKGLSKGLVIGLGAAFVGAGIGMAFMVKQQFSVIDAIGKTSDRIGIATEKLIGFQFAAKIMGVEAANLEKALIKMQVSVSEAGQGLSTPMRALEGLGLSVKDLISLSPDRQLLKIATALAKVQNQSDKTRIAKDLFGRGGTQLLNLLDLGEEGITKLTDEAEKLGLTISRFDAKKIEQANDAITRIKSATVGIARTIAVGIAPFMTVIANNMLETRKQAVGIGPALVSGMEDAVRLGAKFLDIISDVNFLLKNLKNINIFGEAVPGKELVGVQFITNLRKANLFILKLNREATAAKEKMEQLFGVSGIQDAGTAAALGGVRERLGAIEVRSLRNINPATNPNFTFQQTMTKNSEKQIDILQLIAGAVSRAVATFDRLNSASEQQEELFVP